MGTVYLANDIRLDRDVAIKVLHLDPTLDVSIVSEVITRFKKEAKAIAQLSHPNIVTIYDVGEEGSQYYMVIELVSGSSLLKIIEDEKKCDLELAIIIGMQICSALSYAHKRGIVHRDIKPANIMLTEFKIAKLTDFGIAQLNNDNVTLTKAGSILGSILYIPPEQLIDSRNVDQRADLYSLGVTLFQLLSKRLPFEGKQVAEVITKIINNPIPTLRSFDPSIPEVLDVAICKALRKNPNDRYQSADEFKYELQKALEYIKNPNIAVPQINISDTTIKILSDTNENEIPKDTISSKLENTIIETKEKVEKVEKKEETSNIKKSKLTKPLKQETKKNNKFVIKEKFVQSNEDETQKRLILIAIAGIIAFIFILVIFLALLFGNDENFKTNINNNTQVKPSPRATFVPRIKTKPIVKPIVKSQVKPIVKPVIKPIVKPIVKAKHFIKPAIQKKFIYKTPVRQKAVYKPVVRAIARPIVRARSVIRPKTIVKPIVKPIVKAKVKPQEIKKNFGEGY